MEPITIIAGVVMAIGAIAGIVLGIVKVVKDSEDGGPVTFNGRPNGQTHADIYARTHRPNPHIIENNRRFIQQPLTVNQTVPTYVPVTNPPMAHSNIDPIYAPVTTPMMNNAGFVPYQTQWVVPQAFQPSYTIPQYTPTERNQRAASEMCDMMNRMRPNRSVSDDIIDCVLSSVEPDDHRYGNAAGVWST